MRDCTSPPHRIYHHQKTKGEFIGPQPMSDDVFVVVVVVIAPIRIAANADRDAVRFIPFAFRFLFGMKP